MGEVFLGACAFISLSLGPLREMRRKNPHQLPPVVKHFNTGHWILQRMGGGFFCGPPFGRKLRSQVTLNVRQLPSPGRSLSPEWPQHLAGLGVEVTSQLEKEGPVDRGEDPDPLGWAGGRGEGNKGREGPISISTSK